MKNKKNMETNLPANSLFFQLLVKIIFFPIIFQLCNQTDPLKFKGYVDSSIKVGHLKRSRFLRINLFTDTSFQDPIIDSINAAVDRLTNSTNFLQYLGKHALIVQDELPTPSEDHVLDDKYHFMSLLLNLANTFLYMVNTYIIVPTADDYSMSLGAAATVCGIVIGSMAVAQVFSSVYFSAWSNKSYIKPLIFSSVVLLAGNTLYALAYDLNSIYVLLVGRLFCG